MTVILTSSIVFACVAGGGMLGLFLRSRLPAHHRGEESKDVVKLGMGLIGTMSALLLSMQLSSAKDSYDKADDEIKQVAAKIGYLDRVLATYGPEASSVREALRTAVTSGFQQLEHSWGTAASLPSPSSSGGEALYHRIQELPADTPARAALKVEAASLATEMGRIRWLMFAQTQGSASVVFMVVVVIWLALVFAGFGLLGTPNATVVVTLILCAMSVSAAIGLILELNRPFGGLLHVSTEPIRQSLSMLGQ